MDDDLIAYLEKKIKALEAENQKLRKAILNAGFQVLQTSGDWSIHDVSQLAKKDQERTDQVIAENIDLRIEIESLKKQLAAAPHWVPVAEFKSDSQEHIIWNAYDQEVFVGLMYEGRLLDVTHVLVGLSTPASNEDPRGDGDQ